MDAKNVYAGEWYLYNDRYAWLVTGVDDAEWGEPAYTAVNEDGWEGVVFASELSPTEL